MTIKEKVACFKAQKELYLSTDVISKYNDEVVWYYKRKVIAKQQNGKLQLFVDADAGEIKRCAALLEAFEVKARIVPAFLTKTGGLEFGMLEVEV
jgi:hypothetical protein